MEVAAKYFEANRYAVTDTSATEPDSNVEMTWQTFAGEHHELYLAIVKERCDADGLDCTDEKVVVAQFRLHLHRGIGYLATPGLIRGIDDLVRLLQTSGR